MNKFYECVNCKRKFSEEKHCPECGGNRVNVWQLNKEIVKGMLGKEGKSVTEESITERTEEIISSYLATDKAARELEDALWKESLKGNG